MARRRQVQRLLRVTSFAQSRALLPAEVVCNTARYNDHKRLAREKTLDEWLEDVQTWLKNPE